MFGLASCYTFFGKFLEVIFTVLIASCYTTQPAELLTYGFFFIRFHLKDNKALSLLAHFG